MRRLAALVMVFGLGLAASADVVHLKAGSRLDGDVKKGPAGYTVTLADGSVKTISSEQVKSIELAATPGSADAAKEKLNSLRRSVDYLDDPAKIIARYQRFIEQNAGQPIEMEAR